MLGTLLRLRGDATPLRARWDRFAGIGLETGASPAAIARNLVDHNLISGAPCGTGIGLTGGQDNRFVHNDIEQDGAKGIVDVGAHGNVIAHNRITHTRHESVHVFDSTPSRVEDNAISDVAAIRTIAATAS